MKTPSLLAKQAQSKTRTGDTKIAIVGMSCLFPGARDLAAFWTNIVKGVDATRDTTAAEWDPERFFSASPTSFEQIYCKRGGFITELADFEPLKYGVMPNSVSGSDPDQLLALKVASEALADAGYDKRRYPNNSHAVILGRTSSPGGGCMNMIQRGHTVGEVLSVIKTLNPFFSAEQLSLVEEALKSSLYNCNSDTIPAVMPNVLAGRIAGRLGFKGRSMILDAACASSLVAVEIAVRDLIARQCDLALAGGIHVNAFAVFYQMFCGLGALSRQQIIRPFDDSADGTILGEGLGMVVLKRLEDALKDNDRIYAIISGVGSSSDGVGTSMLAPSADGEALALARAYEMAEISPSAVALLEAHGTGTPTGDVAEMQAIERVFGTAENHSAWCAIGSVKSMIGHCQAASGIAGLIKTALSLYHRVLPPTLHVEQPNRHIDWSRSPCYINTQTRPWIHPKVHPQIRTEARKDVLAETPEYSLRTAAVSAFGFGGVNAHAILEEFDDHTEGDRASLLMEWEKELCLFTGSTHELLCTNLRTVHTYLQAHPECALRNVAFTLSQQMTDYDKATAPLAILAESVADLVKKIESVLANLAEQREELSIPDVFFNRHKTVEGGVSFVLPGLGAAYPHMLSDLCLNFPELRAIFDFVDDLAIRSGSDLIPSKKIFPRPFHPLTESSTTLAAMDSAVVTVLMAEWALYLVLQKLGVQPDALLGCSTGEFAALNIGGAADILEATPMFYRLSTKVAGSVPKDELAKLKSVVVCADFDSFANQLAGVSELYLSAALSPSQTILSGSQEAVSVAVKLLTAQGLECHLLPTAIPYHTPLVKGVIEEGQDELIPLRPPQLPVWSCSNASRYPDDIERMRRMTTELFTQPIYFKKTIQAMYAEGIKTFVEVGPKGVLTPLISDVLQNQPHVAVATDCAQGSSLTQLIRCLAVLASHGHRVDLAYLFRRRSPVRIDFNAATVSQKNHTVKLDLKYPQVTLAEPIVKQVWALQESECPAVPSPYQINSDLEHPLIASAPVTLQTESEAASQDPVLETFLSNMATFHQNLMVMQEQIMTSYLAQQKPNYTLEQQPAACPTGSHPLLRTGLLTTNFSEREASAEVLLTPDSHRYLLDHAIGGPVSLSGERVYLMPLTVALEMMCELASFLQPHLLVVRLSEIRAFKRIRVSNQGCMVRVTAKLAGENRTSTQSSSGEVFCSIEVCQPNRQNGTSGTTTSTANGTTAMQCKIHFAGHYDTAPAMQLPADTARAPHLRGDSLYTPATMFHGPRMQSVLELQSAGKRVTQALVQVRVAHDWFGDIEKPQFVIDPLLLDNSTQPVLFHLFENRENVSALLPFLAESLEIYTDLSSLSDPITTVSAALTSVTSRGTEADVYINDRHGNLLAKFSSISSRRISLSQAWKELISNSRAVLLSEAVPAFERLAGDSVCSVALLKVDKLPDNESTLTWCLDYILNAAELEEYESLTNFQRKSEWSAGRLAAKEAVRRLLSRFGIHPFLADIIISQNQYNQPFAYGEWAEQLGWMPTISISHKHNLALAVAADGRACTGVGVDLEPVVPREEGFEQLALTAEESDILSRVRREDYNWQLTQIWCAKEAAGKALGIGLSANPKSLSVSHLQPRQSLADHDAAEGTDNNLTHYLVTSKHGHKVVVHCMSHNDVVLSFTSLCLTTAAEVPARVLNQTH